MIGFNLSLDRRAAAVNPHGLVQENLNRCPGSLWGLVSNGLRLRILRDNHALSRQSFFEFDVESMFDGELHSDFVLLWFVAHVTRFAPRDGARTETCWLEEWTKIAEEQGTRALGVQDMDIVVVHISPAMEPPILAVRYLNERGVRRIVAKALNKDYAQILKAVGAVEVVYSERDMAIKTAHRLAFPNVLEYVQVATGMHIQEISAPEAFLGKSLRELDLINRFGVQVLAVPETVPERLTYIRTSCLKNGPDIV